MVHAVYAQHVTTPSKNRPRALVLAIAIAVATASSLLARTAAADPPTLRVLDEAAACPNAAELRAAIVAHLGRDPFGDPNAPSVDVAIRREGTMRAEITVATKGAPPRTRTIGDDSCAELVRAAALVAALAIEEDAKPSPTPAPPPPPPAPPPVVPEPPPDRDAPPAAPSGDSLRRARFVAIASATTAIGLLPAPGPGIGGALRVRLAPELWLSARGLYMSPARMPDDTFAMSLAGGGAGACWEPGGSDRVAAIACGHVLGGALAVSDPRVPMREAGSKGFAAATISGGARARVGGPVVVEATLEGIVPFAHPTILTATCPASGFQQPFAAVAFTLGAGVSIP